MASLQVSLREAGGVASAETCSSALTVSGHISESPSLSLSKSSAIPLTPLKFYHFTCLYLVQSTYTGYVIP